MGYYTNKFRSSWELVHCYAWLVGLVIVLGIAAVIFKFAAWAVGLAAPLFEVR